MHWSNVYGTYVPCYLLIKLKQTEKPLNKISDLDEADQRIFFHEYTHFFQDITGGFGHSHIWQTYDKFRQIISNLQKSDLKEIDIPLSNPVIEKQAIWENILKTIEGSYLIKDGVDSKTAFVPDVSLYIDDDFRKMYPEKMLHFLRLVVRDENGRESRYNFGESAVSETMAYLMESKMFGDQEVNDFPYKACQKVAGYFNTSLTDNKEWLFALCDVAMLCPYPGMAFYTILLDMHHAGFVPKEAEQIYEFANSAMHKRGWDMWKVFEENKNGAVHVIKELFNHEIFLETSEWFAYLLETGFAFRKANPFFMLHLYRENSPYEGTWKTISETFGTPQLQNSKEERYFMAPKPLEEKKNKIEPLFLISLKQILNTLVEASYKCELIECCRNAKIGPEVDYRCVSDPWTRADDQQTCAYGAQWFLMGLSKLKVNFK